MREADSWSRAVVRGLVRLRVQDEPDWPVAALRMDRKERDPRWLPGLGARATNWMFVPFPETGRRRI